jgi:hypothetical protein
VKKHLCSGILAFVVVVALVAPSQAGPYAQLSSSESQLAATAPKTATLNQDDALRGITNSEGTITFAEAGTYFVMAAAQVGSADGKGKGAVRLWMRQNGEDVSNSNTEQTITPGFTAVLVCQGVAEIKAGDKLELAFSASKGGEGLGLIASKPKGEPSVPSMIFSAFKVGDKAYAQLSSGDTQAAGPTGQTITLNQTDSAKEIENQNGVVTMKKAGTYFVMAAGQVGAADPNAKGTVRLWVRQNGEDVSNSNTEQTSTGGFTGVLVCQGIMECKAGDKVELLQASSGGGLGMVASAPKGEPVVPSMILSIVEVDSAYAQLSSTETQPGAAAAKAITLNQTDSAIGVENKNGTITVNDAGLYFVVAAGQVGSTDGNAKAAASRLWLRQNGKDVDNSNTEQTVTGKYTAVLVCQGVGEVKAGDKLQLVQSASGAGVGMIATKPKGEPVVPSMIFSLVRVD